MFSFASCIATHTELLFAPLVMNHSILTTQKQRERETVKERETERVLNTRRMSRVFMVEEALVSGPLGCWSK